jgi:RNase H-fold protein (predicted Holliday junction resolvase)
MSALGEKTVLAVDPGTEKCGLAVVTRRASGAIEVAWRRVVPASDVAEWAVKAFDFREFSMIIVGSGSRSRPTQEALRACFPHVGILVVDERETTLQARERYWEHNPRRGWRRLLPATLQTPPEPIDDFAAVVLAERVLAS